MIRNQRLSSQNIICLLSVISSTWRNEAYTFGLLCAEKYRMLWRYNLVKIWVCAFSRAAKAQDGTGLWRRKAVKHPFLPPLLLSFSFPWLCRPCMQFCWISDRSRILIFRFEWKHLLLNRVKDFCTKMQPSVSFLPLLAPSPLSSSTAATPFFLCFTQIGTSNMLTC